MNGNERSLPETCGLSVPPHTVVGTLSPFWVRTAPYSADSLCKEGLLSGCLWCPQSFLERIAFAEAALWGHACAAPDSGVTLFIAALLEHMVPLEARESSRHLAPHCLLLLSEGGWILGSALFSVPCGRHWAGHATSPCPALSICEV